jgi:hypothetical protein
MCRERVSRAAVPMSTLLRRECGPEGTMENSPRFQPGVDLEVKSEVPKGRRNHPRHDHDKTNVQ